MAKMLTGHFREVKRIAGFACCLSHHARYYTLHRLWHRLSYRRCHAHQLPANTLCNGRWKNVKLAHAFHAPFTIDSPFRPHSIRQQAAKLGKNIIVYEGGESLRFDQQAIEDGIAGTLRLMKHLHMIDEAPAPKEANKIIWTPPGHAHNMPVYFNLQ